jgi:uncharacterized protein with HEPN domain
MNPSAATDQDLLAHMLDCIARIKQYTRAQRTVFFASRLVQDAVLRNLQILAESSQRLSEDFKAAEPAVDWRRMAGMRNILVHAYLGGIDLETVWVAIERHLPRLEEVLRRRIHHPAGGS